jgi:arylsulfatase A-like enzyme
MSVRILVPALALLLVAGGCSTGKTPRPRAVFLIVVDTLRPDRLSCYGYAGHRTPNIDALALRGVRFTRAQSVASWTIPSMGAMLTSLYPTQLGLTETPAPAGKRYEWQELRPQENAVISLDEVTLAEILRDAGYRTAAFVDQPGLINYGTFFQGFEEAFYPLDRETITRYEPETLEYPQWAPFLRAAFACDEGLVGRFEEWLPEHREEELFVWLHLLTPHWPYDPDPRYMPNGEIAETDAQKLEERFYHGEVRAVDDLVGRITAAIERHVGLDAALVLFTSDHGEALGERGMHDHGHTLHNEVTWIPLLLAGPTLPRGSTVEAFVRSIDILPTLLELVGADEPGLPAFEGVSLIPALGRDAPAPPVFAEAMLYGATARSLIEGELKLMIDEQEPEPRLFNVADDPAELVDLAREDPETGRRLGAQLERMHGRLVADRERRTADGSYATPDQDGRTLRALRALGYVDSPEP